MKIKSRVIVTGLFCLTLLLVGLGLNSASSPPVYTTDNSVKYADLSFPLSQDLVMGHGSGARVDSSKTSDGADAFNDWATQFDLLLPQRASNSQAANFLDLTFTDFCHTAKDRSSASDSTTVNFYQVTASGHALIESYSNSANNCKESHSFNIENNEIGQKRQISTAAGVKTYNHYVLELGASAPNQSDTNAYYNRFNIKTVSAKVGSSKIGDGLLFAKSGGWDFSNTDNPSGALCGTELWQGLDYNDDNTGNGAVGCGGDEVTFNTSWQQNAHVNGFSLAAKTENPANYEKFNNSSITGESKWFTFAGPCEQANSITSYIGLYDHDWRTSTTANLTPTVGSSSAGYTDTKKPQVEIWSAPRTGNDRTWTAETGSPKNFGTQVGGYDVGLARTGWLIGIQDSQGNTIGLETTGWDLISHTFDPDKIYRIKFKNIHDQSHIGVSFPQGHNQLNAVTPCTVSNDEMGFPLDQVLVVGHGKNDTATNSSPDPAKVGFNVFNNWSSRFDLLLPQSGNNKSNKVTIKFDDSTYSFCHGNEDRFADGNMTKLKLYRIKADDSLEEVGTRNTDSCSGSGDQVFNISSTLVGKETTIQQGTKRQKYNHYVLEFLDGSTSRVQASTAYYNRFKIDSVQANLGSGLLFAQAGDWDFNGDKDGNDVACDEQAVLDDSDYGSSPYVRCAGDVDYFNGNFQRGSHLAGIGLAAPALAANQEVFSTSGDTTTLPFKFTKSAQFTFSPPCEQLTATSAVFGLYDHDYREEAHTKIKGNGQGGANTDRSYAGYTSNLKPSISIWSTNKTGSDRLWEAEEVFEITGEPNNGYATGIASNGWRVKVKPNDEVMPTTGWGLWDSNAETEPFKFEANKIYKIQFSNLHERSHLKFSLPKGYSQLNTLEVCPPKVSLEHRGSKLKATFDPSKDITSKQYATSSNEPTCDQLTTWTALPAQDLISNVLDDVWVCVRASKTIAPSVYGYGKIQYDASASPYIDLRQEGDIVRVSFDPPWGQVAIKQYLQANAQMSCDDTNTTGWLAVPEDDAETKNVNEQGVFDTNLTTDDYICVRAKRVSSATSYSYKRIQFDPLSAPHISLKINSGSVEGAFQPTTATSEAYLTSVQEPNCDDQDNWSQATSFGARTAKVSAGQWICIRAKRVGATIYGYAKIRMPGSVSAPTVNLTLQSTGDVLATFNPANPAIKQYIVRASLNCNDSNNFSSSQWTNLPSNNRVPSSAALAGQTVCVRAKTTSDSGAIWGYGIKNIPQPSTPSLTLRVDNTVNDYVTAVFSGTFSSKKYLSSASQPTCNENNAGWASASDLPNDKIIKNISPGHWVCAGIGNTTQPDNSWGYSSQQVPANVAAPIIDLTLDGQNVDITATPGVDVINYLLSADDPNCGDSLPWSGSTTLAGSTIENVAAGRWVCVRAKTRDVSHSLWAYREINVPQAGNPTISLTEVNGDIQVQITPATGKTIEDEEYVVVSNEPSCKKDILWTGKKDIPSNNLITDVNPGQWVCVRARHRGETTFTYQKQQRVSVPITPPTIIFNPGPPPSVDFINPPNPAIKEYILNPNSETCDGSAGWDNPQDVSEDGALTSASPGDRICVRAAQGVNSQYAYGGYLYPTTSAPSVNTQVQDGQIMVSFTLSVSDKEYITYSYPSLSDPNPKLCDQTNEQWDAGATPLTGTTISDATPGHVVCIRARTSLTTSWGYGFAEMPASLTIDPLNGAVAVSPDNATVEYITSSIQLTSCQDANFSGASTLHSVSIPDRGVWVCARAKTSPTSDYGYSQPVNLVASTTPAPPDTPQPPDTTTVVISITPSDSQVTVSATPSGVTLQFGWASSQTCQTNDNWQAVPSGGVIPFSDQSTICVRGRVNTTDSWTYERQELGSGGGPTAIYRAEFRPEIVDSKNQCRIKLTLLTQTPTLGQELTLDWGADHLNDVLRRKFPLVTTESIPIVIADNHPDGLNNLDRLLQAVSTSYEVKVTMYDSTSTAVNGEYPVAGDIELPSANQCDTQPITPSETPKTGDIGPILIPGQPQTSVQIIALGIIVISSILLARVYYYYQGEKHED